MTIPFLSKLSSLLIIGGFCLSPLGLGASGGVVAGMILLLAGLDAAERGRAAQEGTAVGQISGLAKGLLSLTVWPFYLCVLGLLLWAMNDRENLARPLQAARRDLGAAPARPMGTTRPVNPGLPGGAGSENLPRIRPMGPSNPTGPTQRPFPGNIQSGSNSPVQPGGQPGNAPALRPANSVAPRPGPGGVTRPPSFNPQPTGTQAPGGQPASRPSTESRPVPPAPVPSSSPAAPTVPAGPTATESSQPQDTPAPASAPAAKP